MAGYRRTGRERQQAAVKRGRGRPSEGVRVDVRIPNNLLKRIDRDAKRADVKRAEQIRQIIAAHYAA